MEILATKKKKRRQTNEERQLENAIIFKNHAAMGFIINIYIGKKRLFERKKRKRSLQK